MATVFLDVSPIYGWGWHDSEGQYGFTVPPDFQLRAEIAQTGRPVSFVIGQIESDGHPLDGFWVILSPRHVADDGYYNATFSSEPSGLDELALQPSRRLIQGFVQAVSIDEGELSL